MDPPPVIDLISDDEEEDSNERNRNGNVHLNQANVNLSSKVHDQCLRKEETTETIKALNVVLKEIIAILQPSDLYIMVTIAQKTWKCYDNCDTDFRDSEDFLETIRHNHSMLIENIDKKFVYLKRITDTMKDHRQQPKKAVKRAQLIKISAGSKKSRNDSSNAGPSSAACKDSSDSSSDDDDKIEPPTEEQITSELTPEQQARNKRNLKLLTKALWACQEKIKELEAREVDFDEDADSAYLQEDRYKKRLVQIVQKINNIEKVAPRSYRKKITYNGTIFPTLNKRVEQFVNKKKKFPDFNQMLEVFTEANQELNLNMSKPLLQTYAEEAFRTVGNQLQRHRCHELQENLGLLIPDNEVDPAEKDPELERKLCENQQSYANREAELMAFYTQKSEEKTQLRAAAGKEGEDDTDEDNEDDEEEDDDDDKEDESQSTNPVLIDDLLDQQVSDSEEEMDVEDSKLTTSPSSIKEEDESSQGSLQGKIIPSPGSISPVSTPGNTPNDEINLITSEDSNLPSQPESDTSSQSQGIKIGEAFSIAENPEKLPSEIKSLLKYSDSPNQSEPKVKSPKSNLSISKTKSENVTSFKTFAEAFSAHVSQKSNGSDDEDVKKNSSDIEEELKDILQNSSLDISDVELEETGQGEGKNIPNKELPSTSSKISEEVTQSDEATIIISKVEPVKLDKSLNRPLLSLSPKLTLSIPSTIPKTLNESPKPKVQRARKTFSWAKPSMSSTSTATTSQAQAPALPTIKTPIKTKTAQVSSPSSHTFSRATPPGPIMSARVGTPVIKTTPSTQVRSPQTRVMAREKPRTTRPVSSNMGIMISPSSKATPSNVSQLIKNEPMQTPEISSSSQDRMDSDDDDCIILD